MKDFRGNDSTIAAVEACKKQKGAGRTRFLVLAEGNIKIVKKDAKVRRRRRIKCLK